MSELTTIKIPEKTPFINCKLGREKYADVLTDIVRTNTDGFVLAIDNKWGAGKTTFVNMWKQKLENEDFQTLYFNAWENDFENNPFVAITAELKSLLGEEKSATFKKVLDKGSKLSKAVLPSLLKAVLKKYLGEDGAKIVGDFSKGTFDAFEEDVSSYVERKQNIKDFHNELQKYISENSNGKPIVFIIDELDRCRPNYAVSVLENIKHLFSVKGIVFVLSIDKEQLGYAVRGVYGSDEIDSEEYLRRFIDVEYSLPAPGINNYILYLIDVCKLNDFFNLSDRKSSELSLDKDNFIAYSKFLFELKNPTLRQQEKIFRHVGIVLRSFSARQFIIPELLIYLIYLRLFYREIYSQIHRRELSHQQLLDKIAETLKGVLNENQSNSIRINIEALMLIYYNQYLEHSERLTLLNHLNEEDKLELKSHFDSQENQSLLNHFIRKELNHFHRRRTSIEYLLTKIDLLEPLQDL